MFQWGDVCIRDGKGGCPWRPEEDIGYPAVVSCLAWVLETELFLVIGKSNKHSQPLGFSLQKFTF